MVDRFAPSLYCSTVDRDLFGLRLYCCSFARDLLGKRLSCNAVAGDLLEKERTALITARGKEIVWHANMTLSSVLKEIGYLIPGIFVLVNDEKVRRDRWDTYRVPDGAKIDVHRIAAGG
jgi:thiamine biosynthesis protein ThiS